MEISQSSRRDDGGVDCKHKVFLCHSGEQKDFVEWMYDEIKRQDRSAFFDKSRSSLSPGCDFPKEIFKAIEECDVGVVVLSRAFFTRSRWPMEEFARLAKRKEKNEKFVIILVHYDIELAECRKAENHTEWIKLWKGWEDKRIMIEDWTSAFKLFGPILSISRDKEGDAKRVIGEVVEEVCRLVNPETRGDDSDMQGRERLCELVCAKRHASQAFRKDGPQVVGLYGVGGIGKSTLCKALCENLRSEFGGRVYHAELASKRNDEKEKEMLGEMVKRLLGISPKVVAEHNKTERLNMLTDKLRNQRVFVAIDNVGDDSCTKEQARALLKARFAKDSFLVVTARSRGMLLNVGVKEGECLEMPELEYEEAKRLFLNNAPEGVRLEDVIMQRCLGRCNFLKGEGKNYHYHPLALKVLGGQLGHDPEEWESRLEEKDPFSVSRERESDHQLFSILRSSFDLLRLDDQVLFIDVALFFPERNSGDDPAMDINIITWLRMVHGRKEKDLLSWLGTLKQKSLIEYVGDGNDVVGVHDLWREFCVFEISRGDRRDPPWFYRMDEIHESDEECRFYNGGWEELRRVCLTVSDHTLNIVISSSKLNLQGCATLTVLKLVNVVVENRVVDVSSLLQLRSLEVSSVNVEAPVDLQGLGLLKDLRALIWVGIPSISAGIEEIADLIKLEVLIMSAHEKSALSADRCEIMRIPDLSGL